MEACIKNINDLSKFEPFELVIKVESVNDLAELYGRFNPSRTTIKKVGFSEVSPAGLVNYVNDSTYGENVIYDILKKQCKTLGFKFPD